MKTKARDIVEGWPRGRSTTIASTNKYWQWFDQWPFLTRTSFAMIEQLSVERTYHQMQQAMVDEWFERYRNGEDQFLKHQFAGFARPGELGYAFEIKFEDGSTKKLIISGDEAEEGGWL